MQADTATTPPLAAAPEPQTVYIRAKPGWRAIDFGELWYYRELLWNLAVRDVTIRYKQTFLGVLWAIIPPFFTMVIFTVILTTLFGLDRQRLFNGLPAPLAMFTALAPWQLFSVSLNQSSNSLVGSQNLISKVYFPRLIIPISSMASAVVDFCICSVFLAGMLVWYHDQVTVGWQVVTLPLFFLLAVATALSVGLWLSALNVQYRDVRYAVPIMVQLWMYASPIIYSSARVPEKWRVWYALNPMVGVVDGFRWALLGGREEFAPGMMTAVSVVSVLVLLLGGLFYFRRMEKTFADLV
ncbi:MAG: ABC transporter permease [Planctomycetes bacterium]|nr:ABC transporter permease [Planctomycetota bacterium]